MIDLIRLLDDAVMRDLKINEEIPLKCSAHIILGVDVAIDSIFQEVEQVIGKFKLVSQAVGNK